MSTTTRTLKMKLLIDTKANRVVFAEADKDVVDFLFSLLALPVAAIVEMLVLWRMSMPGSFRNLYASVTMLDSTYVQPGADMAELRYPTVAPSAASTSLGSLLLPPPSSVQPKSFYRCDSSNCYHRYVTDTRGTRCPTCGCNMTVRLEYISPAIDDGTGQNVKKASYTEPAGKGFVKGVVTYTVRDDLTVTPMSTISSITMLNTTAVADFAALQEKTVRLGYTECLAIVKASLQSKTVLTDVFLGKK
ncbi:uncharacterized protein C2845_PM07G01280 [Panicum miliaceum]|uniref:DUF674 domain-containing protein n=1 Tax=Panicum miliaceum TaxID=4540 RepID=A0A3L6SJP6_PANMI|nr:uncharacterized protein C2845_PM07G01280 [Panicum miliaceum]